MWLSMSYFNLIEVSIGCQVWISFSPFDTHERKLSAPYSVSQSVRGQRGGEQVHTEILSASSVEVKGLRWRSSPRRSTT